MRSRLRESVVASEGPPDGIFLIWMNIRIPDIQMKIEMKYLDEISGGCRRRRLEEGGRVL